VLPPLQNVTSLYPVTISTAPPKASERVQTIHRDNPLPTSEPSVVCYKTLFDTGALTSQSVLSEKFLKKLLQLGISAPVSPVSTQINPVVGSAQSVIGRTRLQVCVEDKKGLFHIAIIPVLVLAMDHFDLIINNVDCRQTFSTFFYTSDNWTIITNPYRHETSVEEEFTECSMLMEDNDLTDSEVLSFDEVNPYDWTEILGLLADASPTPTVEIPEFARPFSSVFQPVDHVGIKVPPIHITTSNLPAEIKAKARVIRRDIEAQVLQTLKSYTAEGLHVPSDSVYASPLVPLVKPDGSVRLAVDYATGINQYITTPSTPIPLIKDVIHKLAQYSIFAEIDLTKAYRQLKIDDSSSQLLSYITPLGQFRPLSLPEGVRSAPHIFVQIMYEIFKGKRNNLDESYVIYFDNIYIGAMEKSELVTKVTKVLSICEENNIKLKAEKCNFCTERLACLGYIIENHTITPDPKRIAALQQLRAPKNKKELRSILGSFLLYGSFIQGYASLVAPLYDLLKNASEFVWNTDSQNILDSVKSHLVQAIALHYPDHTKQWVLMTDGSLTGIGGALIQLHHNEDGSITEQIIAVASKKLSTVAQNWSIYEIEFFALVYCIKLWSNLLYGKQFEALVDHNNLLFMNQNMLAKVERWKTFLADFQFTIRIIKGVDNVIADMLSRINALIENDNPQLELINATIEVTDEYLHNKHLGLGKLDHHTAYRTFELVRKELEGEKAGLDMRKILKKIKVIVNECMVCQKNKLTSETLSKQYRALSTTSSFAAISMDIYGPLDIDVHGNQYILVIKDLHDRFCVLYALKDKSESNYLPCLIRYCAMFNIPYHIRTDRGGEFTSALCESLNKFLHTSHTTTLPYQATGNSIVERGNKELGHKLRLYCHQTNLRAVWSEALPLIQCALNNSFNRMIGMSPFICRFGHKAALYPALIDMSVSSYQDMDVYVRKLNDMIRMVTLVSEIIASSEQIKLLEAAPSLDRSIKVGDYVLNQAQLKPGGKLQSKLGVRWLGPSKITKINGNVITIQSMVHGLEQEVDVSSLRSCVVKDPAALQQAANMDLQALPKSIYECSFVNHRGYPEKFFDMMFQVEFPNKVKIWTPYNYARHHPAFVQYALKHKLAILDEFNHPKDLTDKELKAWRKTQANKILKEVKQPNTLQDAVLSDVHKLFLEPPSEPSDENSATSKPTKKQTSISQSSQVKSSYAFESGDYSRSYKPRVRSNR